HHGARQRAGGDVGFGRGREAGGDGAGGEGEGGGEQGAAQGHRGSSHGIPPEPTAVRGLATLTEVLAVDRTLQGGGEGGVAVHQVAPGQLDAVAAPFLDQFQAGRVDGQGIGLVFDLDLAAQRLVEGGGHAGSGGWGRETGWRWRITGR